MAENSNAGAGDNGKIAANPHESETNSAMNTLPMVIAPKLGAGEEETGATAWWGIQMSDLPPDDLAELEKEGRFAGPSTGVVLRWKQKDRLSRAVSPKSNLVF